MRVFGCHIKYPLRAFFMQHYVDSFLVLFSVCYFVCVILIIEALLGCICWNQQHCLKRVRSAGVFSE